MKKLIFLLIILFLFSLDAAARWTNVQRTATFIERSMNVNSETANDSVQVGWVKQYISGYMPAFDFAYDIGVDAAGNLYVTGSSYGSNASPDIVTIKYNSSGDTLWTRRYNGPGNNWDIAYALAIDAAGNAYVTGSTYSTASDFDYMTIKYNSAGVQQWAVMYNGQENSEDVAVDITVDASGNVYVTGYSLGTGTFYDYATVKYNSSGVQQWVTRYNGPGNIKDIASGIGIDLSGNVYVTGSSGEGITTTADYLTVKYNSSGVEQWVDRYDNWFDYATDIEVDASSNVYVTGYSYQFGNYYDYATIKYNTTGQKQWVSRYNGPGNSDDYANAIAVDASGSVYVTGEAFFMPGSGSDYATIKYSPSGVQQWVARYNGTGNTVDAAKDIVVDGTGNVYVTGESRGSETEDDFATIKYNASGVEQCAVRYNGPGNTFDLASALAIDGSGNIYVTGRSNQTGGSIITTIKYAQVTVSVQNQNTEIPVEFSLEQNYPNPFNPTTTISFALPKAGLAELIIYDINGKEVAVLENSFLSAGYHKQSFDAKNLSSGVYFYKLKTAGFSRTKKMLLIK